MLFGFVSRPLDGRFLPIIFELLILIFCGFCLWYKILLPEAYFFSAIIIALLLTIQLVRRKNIILLVLQIALLGLFLRNVYYLNTNYSIVPFDDGNWDYAVVRTFIEEGRISIISGTSSPMSLMEWYSQWPLMHVLVTLLSAISGVSPLHIVLFIPSVISILSFSFVFLIAEKSRKTFPLNPITTPLVLLLYVVAAESIFWPMQFVHQNIGVLFLAIVLFLIFKLGIQSDRKDLILVIFFTCSLAIAHSFTSFVTAGYLILLLLILIIWTNIRQKKTAELSRRFLRTLANISLVSFVFLLVWNENYGTRVWVYVTDGLNRFIGLLAGVRALEYFPTPAKYPDVLTPQWAIILVILRDALVYIPTIFGLFWVLLRIQNVKRYILISSALSFGAIFIINNLAFRVEVFRVFVTCMPIIALLGGIVYSQFANKSRGAKTAFFAFCIMTMVISSFIGLWGHQFAPIHLYTPSIERIEVGERYNDFMRINIFFSEKISISSYNIVLSDDRNPLIYLVSSRDYFRIRQLELMNSSVNFAGKTLICSFKDLCMYSYFARSYSALETIEDAKRVRLLLIQQLNEKTLIFDDGKYRFWVDG